ncbi:T9SS type B sorting domain-containing protein [Flavobacterium sp.]|uniref:T9SS type B sorting domain-containing protein n=1 Tax=Flavobacterium sp. TaxID=239 RepID=UPI0037531F9E
MKSIYFIILLTTSLAFSQQETSVWYFGSNAGIKFDSNGNVTTLTDGQLNTSEGCATIADSNGNLLFYTDGITVWNKNHQIMPNGTGLMGNWSSTQSATIVPLPGSSTLYYVFTIDYEAHSNGFRYSVVDISLNSGLGDVTLNKNILIYTPSNEKLSIVKHANGNDYWVVTHGWNNNSFFSYLLTSSGLNLVPAVSNIGAITTGDVTNSWGYMKISPDGKKLAICNSHIDAEVMDFDNNTGLVSNLIILFTGSGLPDTNFAYGVEFSPNSQLLYITIVGIFPLFPRQLIQYDLSVTSNIVSSAQILDSSSTPLGFPMGLQLAPNGKIYVTQVIQDKLAVINNPNIIGLGCSYQMNALDLEGKICQLGLPPFVSSFFNATFKTENLCLGSSTQFTIETDQIITDANWIFGDGTTSNTISPLHQYLNSGNYTVTVTATSANGISTKTKIVTIYEMPIANIVLNQIVCDSNIATYDLSIHNATLLGNQSSSVFGIKYYNSMTNLIDNLNALTTPYNLSIGSNLIYVKVYNLLNPNCYDSQSFTLTKYLKPIANSVLNLLFCDDITNDGTASFNLNLNTPIILGTQNANDYKVSYHSSQNDATSGNNPLSFNYQNTSNPQTIYIRIENILNTTCFDVSQSFQIGLYKMPFANQPPNMYQCDADNDGVESFNLSNQDNFVLGNQSANDFNITYHNSQIDADFNLNGLSLSQTILNSKIIYVRIENKLSVLCYATTLFELVVKEKPVLILEDSYSICEGKNITIQAPIGFDSYFWNTGSSENSISINQAGNYTLTVYKNYGTITCDDTKNFTVYNSNVATITSIETHDWTDNENDINVYVEGEITDYLYSLDNIHFQDSNQFFGLVSGDYTVYVKDKKGCGTVEENVFLLMYSKFFTPNGDGFNDVWRIRFSSKESDIQIYIYDRYGKMIKPLNGNSIGWNGTLDGELLPSDDYWFVVKRKNGKEYKGHFTMKR